MPGSQGATTSENKIYTLRPGSLRCHRVLGPPRPEIADKAQAGRLLCALPRGAPGRFSLAAKMQQVKTSCKFHVRRHAKKNFHIPVIHDRLDDELRGEI
jgi:hypothetical protein